MNYVKTKTTSEPELKKKRFTDSKYKIDVESKINSSIVLTIFYK